MAARNPSPPPISEQEANVLYSDNIGDTLFSKKWVLKVLFSTTQQIKVENENINVSDSLDSELCKLWDMSMNKVLNLVTNLQNGRDFLECMVKQKFRSNVVLLANNTTEPFYFDIVLLTGTK